MDRIKAIFTFKDVHSENMSCKLSDRIISVPDSAELAKHARQIAEGSLNDILSISRHLVHKCLTQTIKVFFCLQNSVVK